MKRQIVMSEDELDKLIYQAFWRGFDTAKKRSDLQPYGSEFRNIRIAECKSIKDNTVVVE